MNKYIELSLALIDKPSFVNKHFSFVVIRNRIVSIGWNSEKTHPDAKRLGYWNGFRHSELDAVLKSGLSMQELRKMCLVNTRINSKNEVRMSKPCRLCREKICGWFREVWYTTNSTINNPSFVKLRGKHES